MSQHGAVGRRSEVRPGAGGGKSGLWGRLFERVDIASLVYFRIAFGAVMLAEVILHVATERAELFYLQPRFHFKYYGFGWVELWPGQGLYWHLAAVGVLAVLVMLGAWYRVSAALLFVGYTYVFLLDRAYYQNHLYLLSLFCLLMVVVPAHRAVSIDAWRRRKIRSETAPAWALWMLRAQMGIVYFYAGLTKINADWLGGWVLRADLQRNADFPVIGRYLTEQWAVSAVSWAGLLLDLSVVPLLLWRRTRVLVAAAAVLFHVTNSRLFAIEVFPWFSIAATLLFFRPDWPRRVMGSWWPRAAAERDSLAVPERLGRREWMTVGLLVGYFAVQLLLPFRHLLYPGDVNWTEEGSLFAWQMKAKAKGGRAVFELSDPPEKLKWVVDPARYLNVRQQRALGMHPDMILQFAHFLADEYRARGHQEVEVRARALCAMNNREPQPLVDPRVNLAAERPSLAPARWIMPLTRPRPEWKQPTTEQPTRETRRHGEEGDER